jgi:signal transduction histidine kinase
LGRDDRIRQLVVRVRDAGVGIGPEDQARIFGRFVQGDPSSTRRHGGAGLGLAIARQLVELMGGRIALTSQLGGGSAFTVTLPLTTPPRHLRAIG